MRDAKGESAASHWLPLERKYGTKVREGKGRNNFDIKWEEGIWLGRSRNTNEALIGTADGVVRTTDYWKDPDGIEFDLDQIQSFGMSILECVDPSIERPEPIQFTPALQCQNRGRPRKPTLYLAG